MIPLFFGKISEGKLIFDDRESFQKWLSSLEGREVEVSVRKSEWARTIPQCRYYFGVIVKMLSDYTGFTPEETHELLKYQFLKKNVVVDGKEYAIARSTATLTVEEFMEYIKNIQVWAALELNVCIPEPNEVELKIDE